MGFHQRHGYLPYIRVMNKSITQMVLKQPCFLQIRVGFKCHSCIRRSNHTPWHAGACQRSSWGPSPTNCGLPFRVSMFLSFVQAHTWKKLQTELYFELFSPVADVANGHKSYQKQEEEDKKQIAISPSEKKSSLKNPSKSASCFKISTSNTNKDRR